MAHKWAASFSLAVQIHKSHLSYARGKYYFIVFALMTPLGILFGSLVHLTESLVWFNPIINAISAGTFIYLGTLHGLERSTMIMRCCNLKQFSLVILGFLLMAVVAIWT